MTRPNIVMILADDMGYSDLGCFGGEIHTPHLDALGSDGVRMSSFYTTPRCSPSRAALLTGRHPHETGIGVLTKDDGPEGYPGSLDPEVPTVAERLRDLGYSTCLSGKWHLSHQTDAPNATWPTRRGFDSYFGVLEGASSYFQPRRLFRGERCVDHEPFDSDDFYLTDAITDHAVSFVCRSAAEDRPFFMYVAYTAPHWPLQAPEADIAATRGRYDEGWDVLRRRRAERQRELGIIEEEHRVSDRDSLEPPWDRVDDPAWEASRMEVYAAQVEALDRGVGAIVDALRDTGQFDDTLIVFTSDNGGCAEEVDPVDSFVRHMPTLCPPTTRDGRAVEIGNLPGLPPGPEDTYASYGRAWANLSNTPFRFYKRWVHEGGIAAPLVVSWPRGRLSAGRVASQPAHVIDLFPTMLDAAGSMPHDPALSGLSLLDAWRGAENTPRVLFWEHIGNAAVRFGDWKLVREYGRPWELYDLATDRAETSDLSDRHPELVSRLEAQWSAWADRCGVIPWERMLEIPPYRMVYPPPDDPPVELI